MLAKEDKGLYKAVTVTLQEALEDRYPRETQVFAGRTVEHDPFRIYIVRDGETVFYIGKSSRGISARLEQHIEGYSRLGNLIANNWPGSGAWQVELVDQADCLPAIRAAIPGYARDSSESTLAIDTAEKALIRLMRPYLNATHNESEYPLPARYVTTEQLEKGKAAANLRMTPYRGRN